MQLATCWSRCGTLGTLQRTADRHDLLAWNVSADSCCAVLQTHLWQLGRLVPTRLCTHLESIGVLPLLYGASWLMTCFSADFPASFSARCGVGWMRGDVCLCHDVGWMERGRAALIYPALVACTSLSKRTDMPVCMYVGNVHVPALLVVALACNTHVSTCQAQAPRVHVCSSTSLVRGLCVLLSSQGDGCHHVGQDGSGSAQGCCGAAQAL